MRTSRTGEHGGCRGFTLVEILVVLLILSVTYLALTQAFIRRSPELEIKAAAAEVAATLREARGLAIRNNREMPVLFDLDNHLLQIEAQGENRAIAPNLGISLYTATSELAGTGVGGIRFFPDGTSTGGRVRLFNGERKYDVFVDWLTGRIDIRQ